MSAEHRQAADLGGRYSEMNTTLARIRRRRDGEPTTRERARLAELREQIATIKRGGQA
jgi:hypothetical protein